MKARGTMMFTRDDESRLQAMSAAVSVFAVRTMMLTPVGTAPADDLVDENERLAGEYEALVEEVDRRVSDPALAVESKRRQDKHQELAFRAEELGVRRRRALATGRLDDAGNDAIEFHDRRMREWCVMAEENPAWSDALYDEGYRRVNDFHAALAKLGF